MGLTEVIPSPLRWHFCSRLLPSSFAVFLCLQCAGTHRGFGVHIRLEGYPAFSYILTLRISSSFVRSVSMDTWQDEQIRRMQVCLTKSLPSVPFLTYPSSVVINRSATSCAIMPPPTKAGTTIILALTILTTAGLQLSTVKRYNTLCYIPLPCLYFLES